MRRFTLLFIIVVGCFQFCVVRAQLVKTDDSGIYILAQQGASYFAKLSLHCTEIKFPHMVDDRISYKEKDPSKIWPSFYGCYDWHSSVHNHWCLVKLLKLYPNLPERDEIEDRLDFAFNKDRILVEAQRVALMEKGDFEFPYGQSWFFLHKIFVQLKLIPSLNFFDQRCEHNTRQRKYPLQDCRDCLKNALH